MITLRQAVELTLSAIEEGASFDHLDNVTAPMLRRALAEPHDPVAYDGWVLREVLFDNGEPVGHRAPEQEPVAWMEMVVANLVREGVNKHKARELAQHFAAPPQRKPLTEEELRDALRQCPHDTVENLRVRWLYAKDFARAIEAAHGIGEKHE